MKKNSLYLTFLLTLAAAANAHTWLTQDTVDRMLGRMQEAHSTISGSPSEVHPSALYELGKASSELVILMNEEFAAHGSEQQELLMSAVDGARALGVNILWSRAHNRFFYDGEAFREFIKVADKGEADAEARYFLIEADFYLGDPADGESLQARIDEKREFLDRYPDFRERARVTLFLGIDHRDLWRLCKQRDDSRCATENAEQAAKRFRDVRDQNSGDEIGEVGERLLGRLNAEMEGEDG